jgi:DNA modification methylase
VALVERMMAASSQETDLVFDPFGGSGTTLITAEKLNRRCRIMELDPIYADVIIERWQDYTGKSAKHVTGLTFAEAAKSTRQKEDA